MSFETDKAAIVALITTRGCRAASYVADCADYSDLSDCILDWIDTFDRDPDYLKSLLDCVSRETLDTLKIHRHEGAANISNPFLMMNCTGEQLSLTTDLEDVVIVGGQIGKVIVADGATIGGLALIAGATIGELTVGKDAAIRWLGIGGIKDAAPTTLSTVTGPGQVLHYGTQQRSVFGGFQND